MVNTLDRFFVNMAIVKFNYDNNKNILDNYMPLVFETLLRLESDIFSIEEFKNEFIRLAEFEIPTSAAISLIQRALKRYEVLEKQKVNNTFRICKDKIDYLNRKTYSELRDLEQRKYNLVVEKFVSFCSENNIEENIDNAPEYFFEILYELAPQLARSIAKNAELKFEEKGDKYKYVVFKFVHDASVNEPNIFEYILSFVKGSMLTETFYYNSYNDSFDKSRPFKEASIYFDTNFLIRLLGYAPSYYCILSEELVGMLRELKVKMYCFDITFNELEGIFDAALFQLKASGTTKPKHIDDVFDYIYQNKIKASDIEIQINNLEDDLKKKGIFIKNKEKIIHSFSIDENLLCQRLSEYTQSESARIHDIACLQAVFQLREGKTKKYLDTCKAIFITTNSKLARISTNFFKDEYGHSDAPVCMYDSLFSSMVWIKSIKKHSKIPKDRLVASCYAALSPSDVQWNRYIREAEKLQSEGKVTRDDLNLLIYSSAARDLIAKEKILGDTIDDKNIHGSVEDILDKIKREQTLELSLRNEELVIQNERLEKDNLILINRIDNISYIMSKYIINILSVSGIGVLLYIVIYSAFFVDQKDILKILDFSFPKKTVLAFLAFLISLIAVTTGKSFVSINEYLLTFETKISTYIKNKIISLLEIRN